MDVNKKADQCFSWVVISEKSISYHKFGKDGITANKVDNFEGYFHLDHDV